MVQPLSRRATVFGVLVAAHLIGVYAIAQTGLRPRLQIEETPVEIAFLPDSPVAPPPQLQARLERVQVDIPTPVVEIPREQLPPAPTAITVQVAQEQTSIAPATVTAEMVSHVDYVYRTPVRYPERAKRVRAQGTVKLLVAIDAGGRATDVTVHLSSGFEQLDSAARTSVYQWRFKPYTVGGVARPCIALVPVEFALTRVASAS